MEPGLFSITRRVSSLTPRENWEEISRLSVKMVKLLYSLFTDELYGMVGYDLFYRVMSVFESYTI